MSIIRNLLIVIRSIGYAQFVCQSADESRRNRAFLSRFSRSPRFLASPETSHKQSNV